MFDVSINEAKIGCGGVHREAMVIFDEVKLGPPAQAVTGRTCPAIGYFH